MIQLKSLILIGLYQLLIWTWRIRIVESPAAAKAIANKEPLVLAHWHGDEYSLIHMVRTYGVCTMTSTSKDGQIVDNLIKYLGGKTSRGSSTRGAAAGLKGLVRLLREGNRTSIAVDGPRGPYKVPKPGVFEISRLAGAHIIPLGVHVESAIRFKRAWNKAYLPKPFAKIQIYFAEPMNFGVPIKELDPRAPELAQKLTLAIDDASSHARSLF